MIEVEKKFKPTEEQEKALLEGAEFLGEIVLNDVYYDYLDYRLIKENIRLRNRNGSFELKIGKGKGVAEEIEDKAEIEKYFNVETSLEDFIEKNLVIFMEFSNKRKKYKKNGIGIELDNMSWEFDLCEMELLVEKPEDVEAAEEKILNFAREYGMEETKIVKRYEYLKKFKPEIFKLVYSNE